MSAVKELKKVKELDLSQQELSQEELKQLQTAIGQHDQIQMQIGGLEGHKAMLLDSLRTAAVKLNECQKDLEEKYGKVNIDLTTGAITENGEAN